MSFRRLSAVLVIIALSAAACGSTPRDRSVELGNTPVPDESRQGLALVQQETAEIPVLPEAAVAQAQLELDNISAELEVTLAQVDANCAAMDSNAIVDKPNADLTDRTFIAPNLACAILTGSVMDRAHVSGVDLSGADLSGTSLRGARLEIVAVGTDFSGAVLTGVDFAGSDLTGANFSGADLTNSSLQDLVGGGLTGANLTNAILGCNQIEGYPLIDLTSVVIDNSCQGTHPSGFLAVNLSGSLLGAKMPALVFDEVFIATKDFRLTDLRGAGLGAYGYLPRSIAFTGASLVGADLSRNNIDSASFIGADLTDSDLSSSTISQSYFNSAQMVRADLSNVESRNNFYVDSVFVLTNFEDASLSWDDFSGAWFDSVNDTGTRIVAIVCDTSGDPEVADGNSVRYYGLCTSGEDRVF